MKLLACITGASGVIYGKRLLEVLSEKKNIDVHLVVSEAAEGLIDRELDEGVDDVKRLSDRVFGYKEMDAPPASGSSLYDAMVVVPCSLSTLSKISVGTADNLITRSGAVMLKERRKLVLVPRETPLSKVHLENMKKLSSLGTIILPAAPGFYHMPENIDELVDFLIGKILDSLEIENDIYERWKG